MNILGTLLVRVVTYPRPVPFGYNGFNMSGLTAALLAVAMGAPDLPSLLSRLAEEAGVFRHAAQQILAAESLQQRVMAPVRGKANFRTRQSRSEYMIGVLREAPDHPHEFRQVVSVDGKPVAGSEKARHALSPGVESNPAVLEAADRELRFPGLREDAARPQEAVVRWRARCR